MGPRNAGSRAELHRSVMSYFQVTHGKAPNCSPASDISEIPGSGSGWTEGLKCEESKKMTKSHASVNRDSLCQVLLLCSSSK